MTEKRPTQPPFSLRLTFEERAQLEDAAGDLALGAFIRGELFRGGKPKRRRTRGKRPVKDYKELSRLFALLGKTRMASNLNQLAHAANSGSLIMTPESEEKLKQAADDLHFIRHDFTRMFAFCAKTKLERFTAPSSHLITTPAIPGGCSHFHRDLPSMFSSDGIRPPTINHPCSGMIVPGSPQGLRWSEPPDTGGKHEIIHTLRTGFAVHK